MRPVAVVRGLAERGVRLLQFSGALVDALFEVVQRILQAVFEPFSFRDVDRERDRFVRSLPPGASDHRPAPGAVTLVILPFVWSHSPGRLKLVERLLGA